MNFIRKVALLFVVILTITNSYAENSHPLAYNGYSGGMMLHIGYAKSNEFTVTQPDGSNPQTLQASGAPMGIGGAVRIKFGNYLRVGTEGYVSTLNYGEYDSYASVGWGGLSLDCSWEFNKWTMYVGSVFGGGSYEHLTLLGSTPEDYLLENNITSYRKYGFAVVDPYFGVEYALTPRIHVTLKADYLLNVSNHQDDFISGFRLFAGFMFCR